MNSKNIIVLACIFFTIVAFLVIYYMLSKEMYTNYACYAPKDDTSLVIKGLYKNGHGIMAPNIFESKHDNNVDVFRELAGLEIMPTVDKKHALVHPWIKKINPKTGVEEYFNPMTRVFEKHKPESLHENCFIIDS